MNVGKSHQSPSVWAINHTPSLNWLQTIAEFNVPDAAPQKERKFNPDGEKQMLIDMVKKYGDDVKAMARDKLNVMQHTVKQLQKKLDKMNSIGNSGKFSGYLKNPVKLWSIRVVEW